MCTKVIYLYNIPTTNTYREILTQYCIYNLGKTQRVFKVVFFLVQDFTNSRQMYKANLENIHIII